MPGVVITLVDLKAVLGRRLTQKLIEAKWIVPVPSDRARGIVLDALQVHRALGRLVREGHTLSK